MAQKLLLLAAAGALGTLARYVVAGWTQRLASGGFPWGTLAVNGLGCLLFGVAFELMEGRVTVSSQARIVLLIGFMGAFTTFSTFAFETEQLLRGGQLQMALVNITTQNVLGLTLLFVGMELGRRI